MNRREFFGRGSVAAAAAVLRVPANDPDGPPRRLDVRDTADLDKGVHYKVEVSQYGAVLQHCVAYDIDAQTAEVYVFTPTGELTCHTRLLRGGIAVAWLAPARERVVVRKDAVAGSVPESTP